MNQKVVDCLFIQSNNPSDVRHITNWVHQENIKAETSHKYLLYFITFISIQENLSLSIAYKKRKFSSLAVKKKA